MKKDLHKWAKSGDTVKEFLSPEVQAKNSVEDIFKMLLDEANHEDDIKKVVQFIWCEAQKQFLKDILDSLDENMDDLFKGKDIVVGTDAHILLYESNLKNWLHSKYHYLKRKNDPKRIA